jgi:hypothetical protein
MDQMHQQPEIEPTIKIDSYFFKHVDLQLINTDLLRDMMIQKPQDAELIDRSAELPSPLTESSFSFYPVMHREERSLWGSLEFDLVSAKESEQDTSTWIEQLFTKLSTTVDDDGIVDSTYTLQLDHDDHTLYLLVNPDTYVAVIASASPDRCYIGIETFPVKEVCSMAGIDLPYSDVYESFEPDPYVTLTNTAYIWALAHNIVVDLYGISKPKHRKANLSLRLLSQDEKYIHTHPHDPSQPDNIPSFLTKPVEHQNIPVLELLPPEDITFSSIGGSHDAVKRLREIKTLYTPEHRNLAREMGVSVSNGGFILYGPPGTGKTLLMKAFGNELGAEVITINSEKVIDKWVGNSGRNISEIFENIKQKTTPTLVVMDEFDTLGVAPQFASSSERLDVTNILKREISELSHPRYDHIFLATATNNIDRIDPALLRSGRLEKIYISLPNQLERADIWACLLNERFKDQVLEFSSEVTEAATLFHSGIRYAEDVDPLALAQLTDEMSGADIHSIIEQTWTDKFLSVLDDPSVSRYVGINDLKKNIIQIKKSL